MAPTPNFLIGAGTEDTSPHAVVPDLSDALAQARLRRQSASAQGRQQAASRGGGGGGRGAPPRKTPQRGLGVAELERLRCGAGAPPRKTPYRGLSIAELERLRCGGANAAAAAAAAANLQAQGHSVVLQQHHDYLPASKTRMGLAADRGTRDPAATAAAATNAPGYCIDYVAAALSATRKQRIYMQETAGEGFLVAPEGRKEVREIEFFPTRISSHGGGPGESELRRKPPSSSSPPGGVGGSLDLSLRL